MKSGTVKAAILTAIHFKGIAHVKATAAELADDLLCTVQHVRNIIRQVETGKIIIRM